MKKFCKHINNLINKYYFNDKVVSKKLKEKICKKYDQVKTNVICMIITIH